MSKKEDKIIEIAHKRFALAQESEAEGRLERLDDIKFVRLGDQWPESVKKDRTRAGAERPMLTINRIFQFRNQIVNELRQNTPSIKFKPSDSCAHKECAEMREGLVRHIQAASKADIAYDVAAEWQVDTGLGYIRVITDYVDPESFDQEIVIKAVPDPTKVYFDPNSTEFDGSDAQWAFVVEDWTKDDFEENFPGVDTQGWGDRSLGDSSGWITKDNIRVAEYFVIEKKNRTLCLLQDGSTIFKDELPKEAYELIKSERKSESKKCIWYKLAGDTVLDTTELPTSYIPVIPVYGSSVWVEGKRHLHGLTRYAKDPAKLYNFFESANAELLALAPRSPYIAAEGQLDGHEAEWKAANRINLSVLTYNPVSDQGTQCPPPRREPAPGVNPGFESAMNRSIDDMKSTMGIYDASLGNRESDQSGKAILSQQQQASTGNFHFSDNLSRSISHLGTIINEMLVIYDTERVVQILGEDGQTNSVQINPDAPEAYQQVQGQDGKMVTIYNLQKGKYDVVVDTGPSYTTKRQEAAAAMMEFLKIDPAIMQVAGDLIVNSMDWPGAEQISKRMKAMLPPQIQAEEQQEEGAPPIDPQVQQQMEQMAQMVEHLSQELQGLRAQAEGTEAKMAIDRYNAETKRIEVYEKIRIDSMATEGKMNIDQARLIHDMAMADMQNENAQQEANEVPDEDNEPQEPQEDKPDPHAELAQRHVEALDKLSGLVEHLAKPKTVVRDETGRITGVQ